MTKNEHIGWYCLVVAALGDGILLPTMFFVCALLSFYVIKE